LPHLRCERDDGRKKRDEKKSHQSCKTACGPGQPFVEHPAENGACDYRGQPQPEFRSAERAPEIKQEGEERRMRGSETCLVGKRQRVLVG
jgi:hypothetical protein